MALPTVFISGDVFTAANANLLRSNQFNQTVSTKTASYTLVAADAGTKVVMNSASATTITVNTSLFTAGDTLTLLNIGAGVCTITAGTATVSSATSLLLVQYGSGTLYFTSAGVSVFQADSSVSADISDTNRNVVINGAMQVAQRGTSTASITSDAYYTADRWLVNNTTQGTWTQSVEADAPTGSGFRNSLKMLCTTADASPAAGDFLGIEQTFEGQNVQQFAKGTASAKPFTLSFWVKSNLTGTYIALLQDADNGRSVSASYTISVSATWEKKTITFPADITGALDNDNQLSLRMRFFLGAGSSRTSGTLGTTWATTVTANLAVGQTNLAATINNYWQVTGVQLEVGSVATPFEFEDIGTTLTKCQRYYYKTSGGNLGVGLCYSTTGVSVVLFFPNNFRTTPSSVETSGTAANYLQVLSNTGTQVANIVPLIGNSGTQTTGVSCTSASTGLVQGNATFILGVGGYLAFSVEL